MLLAPFLPFSSEKLHSYLGYDQPLFGEQFTQACRDTLGEHTVLRYQPGPVGLQWKPSQLKAGGLLNQPGTLFRKLDHSIVEEERARLG